MRVVIRANYKVLLTKRYSYSYGKFHPRTFPGGEEPRDGAGGAGGHGGFGKHELALDGIAALIVRDQGPGPAVELGLEGVGPSTK